MDHRRRSYASVAGGNASGSGSAQGPTRSGALAGLVSAASAANNTYAIETEARHPGSTAAVENTAPGIVPSSWGKASSVPKHWIHNAMASYASDRAGGVNMRPSYLKGTRYLDRLEATQRVKISTQREIAGHGHQSNGGSLSNSSSSVNLHKMAPSHRGMTYEIIESVPPAEEDVIPPLPSQWKEHDRTGSLEISPDGLELRCSGLMKSQENDAAAARTDHPIPSQCGIYYYEVSVLHKSKEGIVAVGFSGSKTPLDRLPGWEPDSWAYHGDDGKSYCCQIAGKNYGPQFTVGDIVGCGINFRTNTAFFTRNGVNLGPAFKELKDTKLYPSVGMKRVGTQVRLNFGQSPFMFDIDGMMMQEWQKIRDEIDAISISSLTASVDESTLIKELVGQFLRHDGYVNTVEAFAEETGVETKALQKEATLPSSAQGIRHDVDAVHRQQIRAAVLDGDIDRALKLTRAHYPQVLEENPGLDFRLRCRKFVEMMRLSHEPTRPRAGAALNGHSSLGNGSSEEIFAQDMELDEAIDAPDDWDRMDTEDGRGALGMVPGDRMRETMEYGTVLSQQYKDDRTKDQALKEIFSLFAYQDLKNSPAAPILDITGRVPVAEELNSAILVSLGKSSAAAIEKIYRQTETLIDHFLTDQGGPGAFVNISHDN